MSRLDLHGAYFGGRGFTLYHAWGPHGARPLTPHFHDEYLICAQLAGHEECQVAGKLHTFSAGDLVLINPQQVHTGNARGTSDLAYITLYVDRAVVHEFADGLAAPQRSPEFTQVRAAGREALTRDLQALLALVRGDRSRSSPGTCPEGQVADDDSSPVTCPEGQVPGEALEVDAALQRVLLAAFGEFSNLRAPLLRSTNRVSHRMIARVLEYIRAQGPQHNPTAVTLDELAAIAGLSKFHFLRQFTQVVGITPGAYLRTLRLCHAARKLRERRASILEVALSVGFADHPSFSRAFARHMGMTPSQYQALGPS